MLHSVYTASRTLLKVPCNLFTVQQTPGIGDAVTMDTTGCRQWISMKRFRLANVIGYLTV